MKDLEGIIAQQIRESLEESNVLGFDSRDENGWNGRGEFDVLEIEGATSDTQFDIMVSLKGKQEEFEVYRITVTRRCHDEED